MAIPREAMQRAVDAGHADTALIGLPVSLVREILQRLPVEVIANGGVLSPTKEALA